MKENSFSQFIFTFNSSLLNYRKNLLDCQSGIIYLMCHQFNYLTPLSAILQLFLSQFFSNVHAKEVYLILFPFQLPYWFLFFYLIVTSEKLSLCSDSIVFCFSSLNPGWPFPFKLLSENQLIPLCSKFPFARMKAFPQSLFSLTSLLITPSFKTPYLWTFLSGLSAPSSLFCPPT